MLAMRDGWPVRVMHWDRRADGPGSLLLVSGRGDFIEKNCLALHELVDAGWGVATFDWRGQGRSGRIGVDPMKGDSPGFDVWRDDLGEIIAWAGARLPAPLQIIAHSMGGHLLVRHLAAGRGGVGRAVLTSPMLGLMAPPFGPWVARWLAALMVGVGRGGAYVLGGGPYRAGAAGEVRQRMLTSDADIHGDEGWWIAQDPALAIGSVTWRWLADAFASLDALAAAPKPGVPLLITSPELDSLVDPAATRARAVAWGAELASFAGAGHELLRETDHIRHAVLARMTNFLCEGS